MKSRAWPHSVVAGPLIPPALSHFGEAGEPPGTAQAPLGGFRSKGQYLSHRERHKVSLTSLF